MNRSVETYNLTKLTHEERKCEYTEAPRKKKEERKKKGKDNVNTPITGMNIETVDKNLPTK